MALFELLDKNELQRLQDEFCAVAGVSAYCMNHDGGKVTRISGDDRYLHAMQERMAFERVQGDDSLEDLALEELPGQGQVAAMSIEARGTKELFWIVYRPQHMTENAFYQCLELLRDASISFLQNKIKAYSAQAESIRREAADRKTEKAFEQHRVMTHILQLLDNPEPVENVMNEWLGLVSIYLDLDTAEIFKLQPDGKSMDVICEWRRQGVPSFFDKTSKVSTYSFLNGSKLVVVNTDQIAKPEYRAIYEIGVKAIILYPLCHQEGKLEFVLSLNDRKAHAFEEEEIKFVSDAVKILENILIRRKQKNSLTGAQVALEAVLDHVNSCIMVRDEIKHKLIFANKSMQAEFAEELKSGTFRWLLENPLQKEGGEDLGLGREIFYEEKKRWYDLNITGIKWTDGSEAKMYSLYDITSKKRYQGKIEKQEITDFLTGLYNRMCCERDLAVQIDAAKKSHKTGALLYLDLDDFKHINDGLGHQYGDALLKAVSHAFQSIPGIEQFCYRMGGDEFVIVIPPESYHRFEKILEDIQKVFCRTWTLKDTDYYCTMSMGIVTFPDKGDSVPDLVKKADIAMYAAKKAGKNRIEFYSDSISSSDRRRLDMEKNMRDATTKDFGEFEVYYQPIIDVQGSETKCNGAEALIRWNSRKLGFVTPVEFIPLAEYLGLINPIGNHVLLEACKQCKEWNDRGFDYKVNVNLSVVQLLQRDIVETVSNALIGTGLAPEHLTLEVTESLAINDMERMKKILGRIKELGVKIALDDFGTGYSSLNHIREIPFDIIKVDQSFVKDLAEDAYSQSFIKLVSELAETIGVNVCVEGIETDMQHQVLQGMRIKYIQGYYYDKPMSRRDFEAKYCKNAAQRITYKEVVIPVMEEGDPEESNIREGKKEKQAEEKGQEKQPEDREQERQSEDRGQKRQAIEKGQERQQAEDKGQGKQEEESGQERQAEDKGLEKQQDQEKSQEASNTDEEVSEWDGLDWEKLEWNQMEFEEQEDKKLEINTFAGRGTKGGAKTKTATTGKKRSSAKSLAVSSKQIGKNFAEDAKQSGKGTAEGSKQSGKSSAEDSKQSGKIISIHRDQQD